MLAKSAMLFGEPVQVKDSILSIPVPPISSGGRARHELYFNLLFRGRMRSVCFSPAYASNIHLHMYHKLNPFIKFLWSFFSLPVFLFYLAFLNFKANRIKI